jgi:hypothetical protein
VCESLPNIRWQALTSDQNIKTTFGSFQPEASVGAKIKGQHMMNYNPLFSHSKCNKGKILISEEPPALKLGPVAVQRKPARSFVSSDRHVDQTLVVSRVRVLCDRSVSIHSVGSVGKYRVLSSSSRRIYLSCCILVCMSYSRSELTRDAHERAAVYYDLNNPPEMSAQDRGSAKKKKVGRAGIEPKGKGTGRSGR